MTKELVDEKATKQDGSRENSLPPLRGRVGVGGSLTMEKCEPRPCGCNTRKLVNNRFPALKGWGLRGDNPQSLISSNNFTHFTHLTHLTHSKKAAFTLAEILITLAVIGIVAAMTIPTVMNKYQQKVTETRLAKFYSVMNNAIELSEIDNGYKTTWNFANEFCSTGYEEKCLTYNFEKFYKPYLKILSSEYIQDFDKVNSLSALLVYFPDGSAAAFRWQTRDIMFYPFAAKVKRTDAIKDKDNFLFGVYPNSQYGKGYERYKYFYNKGMEPYIENSWHGNEDELPCLKRAQLNGWKFPDDCNPFK